MKNVKKILAVIFSASFCIFCLMFPSSVKSAAGEGIDRCISVVIPSLYAMMTASALLLRSGIISSAGRFMRPVSRLCFGINGELGAVLFFSLTAGYPVGAKMICSMYAEGRLSKRYAELLSGLCFGSGAAFVFGCAASSQAAGRLIMVSTLTADFLMAFAMAAYFRKNLKAADSPVKINFSADMLTDSVTSSGRAMGDVCLCIIIFSVFSAMLREYGILPKIAQILPFAGGEKLLCAVLDVTSVSGIASDLPMSSALLSFGGLCVFLQISAIFRGRLSVVPLVIMRTIAAVLSYFICRMLMPFFMSSETVDVFAVTGRLYRETSPVPSIMLVLMTVVLIADSLKIRRKSGDNIT